MKNGDIIRDKNRDELIMIDCIDGIDIILLDGDDLIAFICFKEYFLVVNCQIRSQCLGFASPPPQLSKPVSEEE